METVKKKIVLVMQFIMGLILLAMIVSNFIQMVTRYFINVTVVWVEDFSVLGLYWLFALGVPMAWLIGAHMEMNVLDNVMSDKFKSVIKYLTQVSGVYFGTLFIRAGMRAYKLNKGYVMSIIGFDEKWRYVPLIVCGYLLVFAAIYVTIEMVLGAIACKKTHKEVRV